MARRRRRDAARRRGRCNNDDTTTTRTKRAASLRKASKGQGSNRALDTRVPISVRANNDATRRDDGADEFRPAASRRPRALPRPRAAPSTVFARSITPRRAAPSTDPRAAAKKRALPRTISNHQHNAAAAPAARASGRSPLEATKRRRVRRPRPPARGLPQRPVLPVRRCSRRAKAGAADVERLVALWEHARRRQGHVRG